MDLSKFRAKQKITQRKLAEDLQIPPTTLNNYEKQQTEPSIKMLIKLADYFHITIDELVDRPTNLINKMALTEREQSIIDKVLKMDNKQQELTELYIDTMMGNL